MNTIFKTTGLCVFLFACTPWAAAQNFSIDYPSYQKRNTDALEISRIVRNDTATILYMDAYSRPNYWIRLASELSLHGVQSGKNYPVIRSQGFELDKQVYMPASGNVTFTLQFAPIDPQDRTIDFVESNNEEDFRIEGICLDASVPKKKVHCHLAGKMANRPQTSRLILIESNKNTRGTPWISIPVRNGNEMAPITQFISIKKVYGPDVISRFNLYTSMKVMVAPASGYTSGQALQAIAEVAQENLPAGFGYELGGMAREEAETSGSTTGLIFILCFVFVYLLLSAQYESYILPLSVLLSVPFGLLGSFLFVGGIGALGSIPALKMILGTMSNDIYMQIALIMLMGLLAKNAILIVEFALERRRMGMSITWAAVLGAAARLRPILMTSLAMIVGLLPLMFASGAGANGNRTLGTSAIGGMLIGMILQIFIVPALFVAFQYLQEKFKPMEWEDVDNSDAEPEIEQYTK